MRSKIVYDTKNVLNELGKRTKITLVWTKAYIGTKGNEIADSLAKDGGQQGKPFIGEVFLFSRVIICSVYVAHSRCVEVRPRVQLGYPLCRSII